MRIILSDHEIEEAILEYVKREMGGTLKPIIYSEIYFNKSVKKNEMLGAYSDAELEVFMEFKNESEGEE